MTTIEFNKTSSHNEQSSYMQAADKKCRGNNMLIKLFNAESIFWIDRKQHPECQSYKNDASYSFCYKYGSLYLSFQIYWLYKQLKNNEVRLFS